MSSYPNECSVIVLDNWGGHKDKRFIDACSELDIGIKFNTPYAPHIMVHEICGRHAVQTFRFEGRRWAEQGFDYRQQIEMAFKSVTPLVVRAACAELGYNNY